MNSKYTYHGRTKPHSCEQLAVTFVIISCKLHFTISGSLFQSPINSLLIPTVRVFTAELMLQLRSLDGLEKLPNWLNQLNQLWHSVSRKAPVMKSHSQTCGYGRCANHHSCVNFFRTASRTH